MSKKKTTLVDPAVLMDYLHALDDPRIDRTKKHELIDILIDNKKGFLRSP